MQRMRERILSKQDSRRAQDTSHGGISPQVSRLFKKLQPKEQSEDSSSHPHGRPPRFKNRGIGGIGREDRHHGGQTDGGQGEWTDPDSKDQYHPQARVQHRGNHETLERSSTNPQANLTRQCLWTTLRAFPRKPACFLEDRLGKRFCDFASRRRLVFLFVSLNYLYVSNIELYINESL